MNKVIIAGSRDVIPEKYLKKVAKILSTLSSPIELVSGMARGADQIPFKLQCTYPIKQFPAEWDKYGKGAGYIRNEQMAKYSTHLIAIWDGKSKGTGHMIDLAKKYKLKILVIDMISGKVVRLP